MPRPHSKWTLGCGVGCAAAVALVVLLGFSGILFVRSTISEFDEAIAARQRLEERFGPAETYVPPSGGRPSADRLEVFLAVRQDMAPAREAVIRSFSALENEKRAREKRPWLRRLGDGLRMTRTGFGLGVELADFYTARNEALLREGMSLGEYTYLYGLIYYAWLGKLPGEELLGPQSEGAVGAAESPERGDEEKARATVRVVWLEQQRRLAHRLQILLRNQWSALTATDGPGGVSDTTAGSAAAAWRRDLAAELAACDADQQRMPWQDGPPPRVTEGLAPYRERLAAAYSPRTDPFELSRNRKRGWSISAD
jgi:hypothetical protein